MKIFLLYIQSHWRSITAFLLFTFLNFCVCLLFRMGTAPASYTTMLCLFFAAIYLLFDFQAWSRRYKRLLSMRISLSEMIDMLPKPRGTMEAAYQQLLQALNQEKSKLLAESEHKYEDAISYYTLWAHQIKIPISAMRLILQDDPEGRHRELENELFEIERYVEMVLCYLRLEGRVSDYLFANYDLDAIVRQVLRKYAPQFIRRHIRLDYTPACTQVLTDEKWLSFILEQILSNALKYTARGTVSIYLEQPMTLVIQDTGIGIAKQDLPRLFTCGYTGLNGRLDKNATGIGLFLCRRICENLQHTIKLDSVSGQGTTVRLQLDRPKLEVE